MPTGVIVNAAAIFIGGILGGLGGHLLPEKFKEDINLIFGISSMIMGIIAIAPTKNMAAVIFSIIIGTAIGLILHFGDLVNKGANLMQSGIAKFIPAKTGIPEKEFTTDLTTIIVIFIASGTGIYGTLVNGMTGDSTILISKSILYFFTAAIFAANLGFVVSFIAIPQFILFFILFLFAGVIYPLTTPDMITDFKAVGGALMLASGFRIAKIKLFPTADMIPSMILAMPFSWIWITWIMPLLVN